MLGENELVLHTGDVLVLPADTDFFAVPAPQAILTCIYITPEYAIDLVYWQYRGQLTNRAEARIFAEGLYPGVRILVSLGRHIDRLTPVLDSIVTLSSNGDFASHSNQIQARWFTIAHALTLGLGTHQELPSTKRLRHARPTPVRREVLQVDMLLRERPQHRWTLAELAANVHLSAGHLSAVCSKVWGYPPRTRLQIIRVDLLARLLRETNIPVKQCIYQVGWRNQSHATNVFRSIMRLSPGEYRITYLRDHSVMLGTSIVSPGNGA